MPVLHVHLMGPFRIAADDTTLTTFNSPRLQALLAYLILHLGEPLARRDLAFLFWPDSTEAQAHTNLRKHLHELRHALPDAGRFVRIDLRTVEWLADAPFTLDVSDFENAVHTATTTAGLQAAVDLYHGDLLPSCYDDWIIPERERLRQIFIDALEQLISQLESQRNYRGAITYAHRLLQQEPLREETYVRLMKLYTLCGDRAGALRTYHTCVTALSHELEIGPSQATREMYEHLINLDVSLTASPSSPPRLVGRDREWAQLLAEWRFVVEGHPHLVLLTGEVGIGKTRLAEELLQWAARQGIATVSIHCSPSERHLAYAPVAAWLRARPLPPLDPVWLGQISRLLPEIATQHPRLPSPRPLGEPGERRRFAEALARAVLAHQPLLILLDDLQWCDHDTVEWIEYLLHFDSAARLLLVATLRLADLDDAHSLKTVLPALRSRGLLTEIALAPLTEAETALLAANTSGQSLDSALTARLFHETEGNPLFILEMVRRGFSPPPDNTTIAVPETIEAVIQSRLAQLSPAARQLLELAAALGHAFTDELLLRATGMSDQDLVRALDELWQRRIIREISRDAYEFSHVLFSQVVYKNISPARRRLLHQKLAEALVTLSAGQLDGLSGEIANNFEQAGLLEQAIQYYLRAGDAARRMNANESAVNYYQHVLSLLPKKEPLI